MSFIDLELDLELLQTLAENEFIDATEIQQQAIPAIMEGVDLLACAATGSGKTLAFVLPALQHLLDQQDKPLDAPRIVILTPTRELANQILHVIKKQTALTDIRSAMLVGGVPYGNQQKELSEGVDILVATPGRLLEMDAKGWLDLSVVQMLIIDEADRMLDMGFIGDIRKIADLTPITRQTLMFSATLEGGQVEALAQDLLNNESRSLTLAPPRGVAGNIQQTVYLADNDDHKQALLKSLISRSEIKQALVFVASRKQVDTWVQFIRRLGIMCDGLHGELPQGERTTRLKRMRRGRLKVIVATDVAARGLDLLEISHVINLHLPRRGDIYVHRAGRSGRDGGQGFAWSLVDSNDWLNLGRIERYTGQKIAQATIDGLEPKRVMPKEVKKTKPKKKKTAAAKKSAKSKTKKKR
ncbi:DEAD/DEAH box helicase [Pontibacterium granulatum]|uniref:DEAD/DEAH box helicase n=1 Tax=Pontibacterium granulatum TaxID=2036029 RepID=UPI00249A05B6|nr:DEAD/DEAH box helicase [Pontibacterium granulatum]MDI3324461.1 DEAD/DEAH box helicase [Pontibacterium granulatum]